VKKDILVKFGKRVRLLRMEKEWTQEKLAEETGFHRTYIGMVERGERNPSLKNIEVFANTFNLPLSDLVKTL
jgi:transcriptional regulator with XRE-family HTH domain